MEFIFESIRQSFEDTFKYISQIFTKGEEENVKENVEKETINNETGFLEKQISLSNTNRKKVKKNYGKSVHSH